MLQWPQNRTRTRRVSKSRNTMRYRLCTLVILLVVMPPPVPLLGSTSDTQFYIDPRGKLLIDDVVLYEAATEGELRPFPRRVLFTGWFDTGK